MPDLKVLASVNTLNSALAGKLFFLCVTTFDAILNSGSIPMVEEKNKLQVLIVDDEVDICYLLKGILRYKNIEAEYVTSLEAAKTLRTEEDPPVIFLDNHLKDGFGIEQISFFKNKYPNSKLVMITAHDTALDRDKAYKAGADFFISKPFSKDVILNTIEKIGLQDAERGEIFPH